MIISPGRGYIFVHIPKTGGTSLALALEARAMADDILIGDTPKAVKRRKRVKSLTAPGRLWKHSRLADIDGMDGLPRDPFVFTLVRNPWDRMVSLYYWARMQDFDHPMIHAAKAMAFDAFLRAPDLMPSFRADGAAGYITDRSGVERCDAFVRLEHLDEDLAPVEAHLGFQLELPHANRSTRPETAACYSPALAAHVAELYREDVARFGYAPPC